MRDEIRIDAEQHTEGIAIGSTPDLIGRRVQLLPVTELDYEFLFNLATTSSLGFRWRFRGETPSPDQFISGIWRGVLAQFIVVRRSDHEAKLGHILLYEANFRNRTAYLAMVGADEARGVGYMMEACGLFLDYVFTMWDFRKLYIDSYGFNFSQYSSVVGPLLHEEGRLRDHEYFGGRFWDLHILAFYRNDWERLAREYGGAEWFTATRAGLDALGES